MQCTIGAFVGVKYLVIGVSFVLRPHVVLNGLL